MLSVQNIKFAKKMLQYTPFVAGNFINLITLTNLLFMTNLVLSLLLLFTTRMKRTLKKLLQKHMPHAASCEICRPPTKATF